MALKDDLLKLVSRYTGGRVGYDGGGTVSTADILDGMSAADITREDRMSAGPDIRRRLQDKAMRGIPLTPLEEAQLRMYVEQDLPARREIKSRELGPEDAGRFMLGMLPQPRIMPREGAEPPGPDIRAEVRNRALAGRPLPGDEALLASYLENDLPARRERAANYMDEGATAGNFAQEMAPFVAGPAGRMGASGLMKAAEYAARSPYGKSAAFALPAAVAGLMPSEAGDKDGGDPRLKEIDRIRAEIATEKAKLETMGKQSFVSQTARENAAKPYLQSIDSAQRRIADLQREMREDAQRSAGDEKAEMMRIRGEAADKRDSVLRDAPKPFAKAFPTTSEIMPWMPVIAGGVTGGILGTARAYSSQRALGAWDKALEKASNPRLGNATREVEANVARNIADEWPVKTGMDQFKSKAVEYSAPAGAGALEGAIIPNLPHAYNILKTEEENPERKALQAYYRGLADNDPERARMKALLEDENALPKGNPAYKSAYDYFTNPMTQMLPRTLAGAGEGAGATLPGSTVGTAFSPWNKTLNVRHARTDALPKSFAKEGPPPTGPTPLTPAPGGASEQLPQLPQRALPPPLPEMAPTAPKATPDPATSVSATTTSKPPASLPDGHIWNEAGRGSKIHGPDGKYVGMDLVKGETKPKRLTKSKPPKAEDDVAGFVEGKAVPKKPDPVLTEDDFKGRARGGEVLDMARRYANGGSVLPPGLVAGNTPGRADALDVEVPNGAFIVPADAVSGIRGAGSNTEAGAKIWEQILPKPSQNYAAGGAVPIRISHGEIVISPDQVAAIGGGNLEHGHRILDQMVMKIREDNISHLSSLPPPAKS